MCAVGPIRPYWVAHRVDWDRIPRGMVPLAGVAKAALTRCDVELTWWRPKSSGQVLSFRIAGKRRGERLVRDCLLRLHLELFLLGCFLDGSLDLELPLDSLELSLDTMSLETLVLGKGLELQLPLSLVLGQGLELLLDSFVMGKGEQVPFRFQVLGDVGIALLAVILELYHIVLVLHFLPLDSLLLHQC